jgi:enoyl-CoA hydratase
MTSSATIVVYAKEGVAFVEMNRPHAMNALSSELRRAFSEALSELETDDSVKVVVLTGAGDRAFSAGLDLKELGASRGAVQEAVGHDPAANPVRAIQRFSKPIIGAINGVAITGGLEIALACDFRVASSNARFADTHAKVGVMPGWGLSQRLPRLIGEGRAKQMSLTAQFIDADTAEKWGLVNEVVRPEQLMNVATALGQAVAAADPQIIARYKSLIDCGLAMPLGDALAYEQEEAMNFNGSVSAADLEARRENVQQSNRK